MRPRAHHACTRRRRVRRLRAALFSRRFLEDETALNLIIMLAFAGGAVALAALVHRRRKRRGVAYKHLGNAGLIAFCLAFAVGGALIGWDIAWRAAVDAASGPATVRCFYRDYDIDKPTGRYAGLHPTKLELAFTNVSGTAPCPTPWLRIAAGDVDSVLDQVFRDSAFAIDLTYYPNNNIFVSADRLILNRQNRGSMAGCPRQNRPPMAAKSQNRPPVARYGAKMASDGVLFSATGGRFWQAPGRRLDRFFDQQPNVPLKAQNGFWLPLEVDFGRARTATEGRFWQSGACRLK